MKNLRKTLLAFFAALALTARLEAAGITDDAGQRHNFTAPPARVVSLLPSVTEIIRAIGASDALAGVTYDDDEIPGAAESAKTIVGGPSTPLWRAINDLAPDLLIVTPRDFQRAKAERWLLNYPILALGDDLSLAEAENRIRALGDIFGRRAEAERVIEGNRDYMRTIRLKTDKIPLGRRKKAVPLFWMPDGLFIPGKNSFLTETIEAVGGIAGNFGDGPVTLEQWRDFDPDFVFAPSSEYAAVREFLSREGWSGAAAVRNGRVAPFPDALVRQAAAHTGYFAAWLSSELFADDFAEDANLVHPEEILGERLVSLDVPYVERARIVESRIKDFVHRTLLVDFKTPQRVVSTNSGERNGIRTVGNSYSPPQTWSVYHKLGFDRSLEDLFRVLKLDEAKTDIMLTGADMNNAVVKTASYRDMTATVIVTGGVESNALRTSRDAGAWYEPGTINILVMTSHRLNQRAATRAVVTVTEAKTAALWDMDIRSAQSRAESPATGTGTDTVIIVSGEGVELSGSGGHTKMGELIADAAYRGVQEALLRQNGKIPARNPIKRLEERGIYVGKLAPAYQAELEELLLTPRYKNVRGFVESAFALSDALVMGQVSDLDSFGDWARAVASKIAGRGVEKIEDIAGQDLPAVLKTALNALLTGIKERKRQ